MSAAGRRVRHAHRELGPVFLPEQAKRYGLVSKPPSHCSPVRHVLGVGLWIPGLVVEPALELGLAQSLGWQQTGGPNIQGRSAKGAGPAGRARGSWQMSQDSARHLCSRRLKQGGEGAIQDTVPAPSL